MLRRLTTGFGLAIGQVALAQQGAFGTKSDPAGQAAKFDSGASGFAPLIQIVVVMAALLLILKWAAPKILSKFNKRMTTTLNGGIRVEESANFAGGTLYVVNARHKTLLLSVGVNGVQCVSDLTLEEKPVASEPKLFMELVDEAVTERGEATAPPTAAVYLETEEERIVAEKNSEKESEALAALERLRRFTA